MAVLSYREILPRTFSHKFGESPNAERKFALTLDGATSTQDILNAVGIFHGAAHPEYAYLLCHNGQVTETDRFHAEATYSYETPASGTSNYNASPLSRADVWSVSTSGLSVPTFRYYDGSGNGTIKPLINTAGDIIEGAQAIEGELRVSVSGNRASFPMATAIAVTGCVNSDSYAGASAHQWLCNGISAQQTTEVVNGLQVTYWQVTAELSSKPSGYKLYLPNVGWNYTSGGQKKRCYVFSEEGEKIPSASVMALNSDGSINFNSDFTGSGAPTILERRVNREVAFTGYFGTPPTS
jgi:hypothetical protein